MLIAKEPRQNNDQARHDQPSLHVRSFKHDRALPEPSPSVQLHPYPSAGRPQHSAIENEQGVHRRAVQNSVRLLFRACARCNNCHRHDLRVRRVYDLANIETDEEFEASMKLVEEYKFKVLYINQFYLRPGTPAANLKQLPSDTIK